MEENKWTDRLTDRVRMAFKTNNPGIRFMSEDRETEQIEEKSKLNSGLCTFPHGYFAVH